MEQFTEEFITSLSNEESRGYMLEVDLEYPQHLHNAHDQYPLGECTQLLLNAPSKYLSNGSARASRNKRRNDE